MLDRQGTRVDIVSWRDMKDALADTDPFVKLECARPINAMLDLQTLGMNYLELVYQDALEAIPASQDNGAYGD